MRVPRLVRYCLVLVPVLLASPAAFGQERLTWNFGYDDVTADTNFGFDAMSGGEARRDTVAAAAGYLSTILDGRGTITFNWRVSENLGSANDRLASAGSWFSIPAPPAPAPTSIVGDVYRQAMGNLAAGDEAGFGTVNFNLGSFTWFASGSGGGAPSGTQYDLYSVMLHELTHALHFASAIDSDGSSLNQTGTYNRYDTFLYKSATSSARLLNADNTAFDGVATDLTNGSVYWGGEFGVAANGGNRVRLHAPGTFKRGTSLSHLDEATFGSLVMSPNIDPGQTARQFSGVEIGMLLDLGWNNYEWDNTAGNWSAGASGISGTKWRNPAITNFSDPRVRAPVGEVTHNMVLTFGGASGSSAYTSTNDLPAAAFKLNRLRLASNASVTNTITGKPLVMSNDNGFDVTPMIEQRGSGAFVIANDIAIPKGLIVGGTGGGGVTLSGVVSGAGGLTKSGSFTLVLGGANTYAGVTTIEGGTLVLAPGGTIPGNVAMTSGTLQFNPSGATTYAGVISGAGNLVKDGTGTLTLTGTSTYSGATAVNAGTLLVNGQLGASAVTVAAGATLGGSGQLGTGGRLTVETGGTLRPGNGSEVATLTQNSNEDATFAGGSKLEIAVGNSPTASGLFRTLGGGDIDLTGLTTDAGGKLDVTLFGVEDLQLGVPYNLTLLNAEGAGKMLYKDGAFNAIHFHVTASGFTFDSAGYTLTGTNDVLMVSFVPVPEPATVLAVGAAGLGALGLACRRRRRRADAVAV